MLPLVGIDVQVVSGRGKTLSTPLLGGGEDNPACATFERRTNDFTENARSLGVRVMFGKFRFFDLGDLVWNELGQLVCPKNMLGEADVYLVPHHGNAIAGVPAVMAALRPRVAIMNNGEDAREAIPIRSRRCTASLASRNSGSCIGRRIRARGKRTSRSSPISMNGPVTASRSARARMAALP